MLLLFRSEHIFPSVVTGVDSVISPSIIPSFLSLSPSFFCEKTANGFTAPTVMSVNCSKSRPQQGGTGGEEKKLSRNEGIKKRDGELAYPSSFLLISAPGVSGFNGLESEC